jgi:hemerythrin-like domain-containing protein
MSDPIAGWQHEHLRFAHLLDLLEAQVEAFARGEHPNYDLMGDIIFYLRSFADAVHHPREDIAFARLVQHDHRMASTVNRLRQEHRVIGTAGDELLRHLEEATGDVLAPRTVLEAAAASYLVYYRNHIATEEREVLPRAAERLSPEDWAAAIAAIPAVADPLFGDDVNERFQALRKQIDREATMPGGDLR